MKLNIKINPKTLDKCTRIGYNSSIRVKEKEMKIRVANKDNMKADICDGCNTAILKGEEYVIRYASWQNIKGKQERVRFKIHKVCDR